MLERSRLRAARARAPNAGCAGVPTAAELTNKIADRSNAAPRTKRDAEVKIDSRLHVDVAAKRSALRAQRHEHRRRNTSSSVSRADKSYDFVVVDSVGREVWHWSNGRMFTQGMQNKQLGTGDVMHVSRSVEEHTLRPGRYTAIATLNSSNYPVEQRAIHAPIREL